MIKLYFIKIPIILSMILLISCGKSEINDYKPPTIENSGIITVSSMADTTLTLNWTAASDNISPQAALQYRAYFSTKDNIKTSTDCLANGTPLGVYAKNITAKTITGLSASTTYYFNVIVKDETGNETAYETITLTTGALPDTIAPEPVNFWEISAISVKDNSLTLNWDGAIDNVSAKADLQYLVYFSTDNNINSLTDCEANGTPVDGFANDIETKLVTGLMAETTYYFNVIVKDTSGNKAVYNALTLATPAKPDTATPTPGDSGTIAIINPADSSLTLNWTKAIDNVSEQSSLQYKIVQSTTSNINTIEDMETAGNGRTVILDWTADIATLSVTGLLENTAYYFNVLVKDEADQKAVYSAQSQTTTATAPIPGNTGVITTENITGSTLTLNWTKSTDSVSGQSNLHYKVVLSDTNNISTIDDMESPGDGRAVLVDWSTDIATLSVTDLLENTTYYFNVIVKDEADQKAVYSAQSQTTTATAPVTGNSGVIIASSVAATSLTLNWSVATDDVSSQEKLQYLAYYSNANNISNVEDCETNGTAIGSYTANIASQAVTGLAPSTSYYFNVIVKDKSENKAIYSTLTQATADISVPSPGGAGILSTAGVDTTSLTVNWTAAIDDVSSQENLQYLVYYSNANNINSVEDCETNGTAIGAYTANITSQAVTGLTASTTYYFNVVVKDEADNKALYSTLTQATKDITAPTPGGSGTLSVDSVAPTSLTLYWAAATDDVNTQSNLQYLVYYSTADNINTVEGCETNGTAIGTYTANITTQAVTGLNASTTYYFNVIVRDESDNKTIYSTLTQATTDITAPTPGGSGTLSAASIAATSLTLNWAAATDDVSLQSNLQYQAYYSTADNINTVEDCEANGTTIGLLAANIITQAVTGLTASTTYYFNVIVKDESENKALYSTLTQATTDITAPTPGGLGTLSAASIAATSLTLNWVAANDDVSLQSNLQYLAFYSTSNNINTLANCETNGTAIGAYTTNITTQAVTGLTASSTYYFNVIVRDESDNKALYSTLTQATTDVTAPTPGGLGTLSATSVAATSLTLNWIAATDDVSLQSNLQYLAFYSTSNNINTVEGCETNGTAIGTYTTNITTQAVTGLNASTTYYFNVIVKDESENKALYSTLTQATTDITAPMPGGLGTLSATSVAATSLTLNWIAATDDVSLQSNLQYLAFYSTSNNINTVEGCETNGTAIGTYTANITTQAVTGLNASTTYYFNVIVRDESDNKTIYSTLTQTTITANTEPYATGVSISGTTKIGYILIGNYTYNDDEADSEGASTFQWLRYDDAACTTGEVTIGTSQTYLLTSSENGKWLKFEVSPEASSGATPGPATTSSASVQITLAKIYIADSGNNRIVRMDDITGANWANYGSFGSGTNQFSSPAGIAFDPDGRMYIADTDNHRIVRVDDFTGTNWTVYGINGVGIGNLNFPGGLTIDIDGKIYIADTLNHRVVRIDDMTGTNWISIGTQGAGANQFNEPKGIAITPDGKIFVAEYAGSRIVRMDDMTGTNWATYAAGIGGAEGIAIDYSGKIYIGDYDFKQIVRWNDITGAGATAYDLSGTGDGPDGIAVRDDGKIYFVDYDNDRIRVMDDMTGTGLNSYGSSGAGSGNFSSPDGMVLY